MPEWAIATVKWVVMLTALLLVVLLAAPRAWQELRGAVSIDLGNDEAELPDEDEQDEDTGPPPLEAGVREAVADILVQDGTIVASEFDQAVIGTAEPDRLLLGFESIPTDPACLTSVMLEVWLHQSTPTPLHVLPAQLSGLQDYTDGDTLPVDALIEGTSPATATTDGSPGWMRWDVTDAYTLAARSAGTGELVALSVFQPAPVEEEPLEEGAEEGSEETAAEEATADELEDVRTVLGRAQDEADVSARLTWAAIQGCGDLGDEPLSPSDEGPDEAPGPPNDELDEAPGSEDDEADSNDAGDGDTVEA